jgi:small-conductance mechanosensitive channel
MGQQKPLTAKQYKEIIALVPFRVGDQVEVNQPGEPLHGVRGRVVSITNSTIKPTQGAITVQFGMVAAVVYNPSELKLVERASP